MITGCIFAIATDLDDLFTIIAMKQLIDI